MKKIFLLFTGLSFIFIQLTANAQTDSLVRTSDNLKSGNYKEVLTSFFQLALNDLAGDSREFTFKSTIYAWLLKADSTLAESHNYLRYKWARDIEVNTAMNVDQNFKVNEYKLGLKWAFLNKREITSFEGNDTLAFIKKMDGVIGQLLATAINNAQQKHPGNNQQYVNSINAYQQSKNYDSLDPDIRTELAALYNADATQGLLHDSKISYAKIESLLASPEILYNIYLADLKRKALGTISGNGVFDSKSNAFKSLYGALDLYVPLIGSKNNKPCELTVTGNFSASDNNVTGKIYLGRRELKLNAGFNKVLLITRSDSSSVLEIKFTGEYRSILLGKLDNEIKATKMAVFTLRARITKDLWIPLDIKYDPDHGNFFGFISAKVNLDGLKNLEK